MRLKLIVIILLSGFLGYSTYWAFLSFNSETFIAKARQDLKASGVDFQYTSYEVSGFPYRLVLTFDEPKFSFKNGPLGFELEAKQMEAIAQPWNLSHFIFFPTDATIGLSYLGRTDKKVTLNPATLGFSIHTLGGGNYRLSAELKNIVLTSNLDLILPKEFPNMEFHLRKRPVEKTPDGNLLEPRLLELAIAGKTGSNLTFQVSTSFRSQDVPALTREGLAAWRDQGGTLELEQLEIADGRTFLKGSGSLTVDSNLIPLGVISIESETWEQTLSFFHENDWLDEEGVISVKDVLEAVPEPKDGGGLPLALTLQDGYIHLGPLRLGEINPIIPE